MKKKLHYTGFLFLQKSIMSKARKIFIPIFKIKKKKNKRKMEKLIIQNFATL